MISLPSRSVSRSDMPRNQTWSEGSVTLNFELKEDRRDVPWALL